MTLIDDYGHRARFDRLLPLAKGRIFEPAEVYKHEVRTATHAILSAQAIDTRTLRVNASLGTDNLILVGTGSTFDGTLRFRGSNSIIFLGAGTRGVGSIDIFQDNSIAYFGAFSEMEMGAKLQLLGGNALIEVGDDCMIGGVSVLSNGDGHPIYSLKTGIRQNENADVRLGNGVRIGQNCRVNKGCTIGDGAAVMEGSIASGIIAPHTLTDGVPGRVIAENIAWSRSFGETLDSARQADDEALRDWRALRDTLQIHRHD